MACDPPGVSSIVTKPWLTSLQSDVLKIGDFGLLAKGGVFGRL
jgi:hypothetical protein